MSIESISITFSVENTARADVMLTSSRIYYRFATIDTCEEGDIPFNDIELIKRIEQTIRTSDSELMPCDVKCNITINTKSSEQMFDNNNISLTTYNSLINILSRISDEFLFIRGFK